MNCAFFKNQVFIKCVAPLSPDISVGKPNAALLKIRAKTITPKESNYSQDLKSEMLKTLLSKSNIYLQLNIEQL